MRIFIKTAASAVRRQFVPARTVEDRVREFGEVVAKRLEPDFRRANIPYPPRSLTLIGLKEEKVLEVYAAGEDGEFRFIRSYPILAASGRLGPKLREGDLQVPEGIYRLESLNPNSLYHLSLRVNYPNEFDRSMAATEDRENLGGDIMIHGSEASIGCLAMGDPGAEDLFILAARTGLENTRVILSPLDFRTQETPPIVPEAPSWLEGLHRQIKAELQRYRRPRAIETAD